MIAVMAKRLAALRTKQASSLKWMFVSYKRGAKVKRLRTVLRFTITGMVIGLLMGWLLSLVSGNVFVILMIGSLVTVVGIVLGIVHRNDPE